MDKTTATTTVATAKAKGSVLLPFKQTRLLIGDVQVISASDELFNHVDTGGPLWTEEGDREVRLAMVFAAPFTEVPSITLGATGIDAAHDQNLRFDVRAIEVTPKGFTVQFKTWGDTHIARASVSWQAIGSAKTATTRRAG